MHFGFKFKSNPYMHMRTDRLAYLVRFFVPEPITIRNTVIVYAL
jgi:hypothetical protein